MRPSKLLNLIADNLQARRIIDVKAQENESTIYLYDMIDAYFGVSAADFVQTLNGIQAPVINLRINSPGGDVFEARAIATAIRQHKSEIVAHIDGVAASAATYIATAASRIEIADGAFMMVHKAWTLAYGNSTDMREVADLLDKLDASIEADYAKKTGKDADTIKQWMADETWFTAQEAVDAGLADALVADQNNGKASAHWNLNAYAKTPKALTDPKPAAEVIYDRAALERKLKLFERIAA
jgi:ATP-dependent Clp protease, protease subunit